MATQRIMRRTLPYAAALVTVGALARLAAQAPANPTASHPALSGVWILSDANPGGGKAERQVENVPMGGGPRPGTGASDGAGSGVGGGRGGFTPAGGIGDGVINKVWTDPGDKMPQTKPKRLSASEAMRKELLTPPEEFSIDLSAASVVIDNKLSGPSTYRINGKTEAHRLTNGSVKIKTIWAGPMLRQDIDGGRNLKLIRTFELNADEGTLRVSVGPPAGDVRRSLYKRKG